MIRVFQTATGSALRGTFRFTRAGTCIFVDALSRTRFVGRMIIAGKTLRHFVVDTSSGKPWLFVGEFLDEVPRR